MSGPVKVDVLVVGSGAAGLSAAVTAAESPAAPEPTTSTSTFTGPLMMDSLLQG